MSSQAVIVFRKSDKIEVKEKTTYRYLVVGGGGGGSTMKIPGKTGGGGRGGRYQHGIITVEPGTYDVIVGKGGRGMSSSKKSLSGEESRVFSIFADGGFSGFPFFENRTMKVGGLRSDITGVSKCYGDHGTDHYDIIDGRENRGEGGSGLSGGNGGSGVVILRVIETVQSPESLTESFLNTLTTPAPLAETIPDFLIVPPPPFPKRSLHVSIPEPIPEERFSATTALSHENKQYINVLLSTISNHVGDSKTQRQAILDHIIGHYASKL